jgi:hypothetical protein
MFKTKKRIQELEKRVADLEVQVQSQQKVIIPVDREASYLKSNPIAFKSRD